MMRDKINRRFFTRANKVPGHADNRAAKISLGVICNHIAASATAAAVNYRASGRAKSLKDMINILKVAELPAMAVSSMRRKTK